MSRIITTLIAILISSFAFSQEFNPKSWDDIANNIASGKDDAVPLLMQFKGEIESYQNWDENLKRDYLMTISLLVEYTSRRRWFKDEEIFLKDALRNFNEKDTIANSPYTRRLWVSMTRLQKDLGDPDALLTYGHQALKMFEDEQDYSYDYVCLLHNIALGYLQKKDYLSAKLYADEAIDEFLVLNKDNSIPGDWGVMLYNTSGMIESEIAHYQKVNIPFTA